MHLSRAPDVAFGLEGLVVDSGVFTLPNLFRSLEISPLRQVWLPTEYSSLYYVWTLARGYCLVEEIRRLSCAYHRLPLFIEFRMFLIQCTKNVQLAECVE